MLPACFNEFEAARRDCSWDFELNEDTHFASGDAQLNVNEEPGTILKYSTEGGIEEVVAGLLMFKVFPSDWLLIVRLQRYLLAVSDCFPVTLGVGG